MKRTFSDSKLAEICSELENPSETKNSIAETQLSRAPVHVVYGGAHLFKSGTPAKLGKIALKNLEDYAPDFTEFARAVWLPDADSLPIYNDSINRLANEFDENSDLLKSENFAAWLAQTIYQRVIEKLRREPIEDFRIDFEDGYGFRHDAEEDAHALAASGELAKSFLENTITPFCGFRVKSFQQETIRRAVRTLDLFLTNIVEKCEGKIPENFVVTLPKITRPEEVAMLAQLLDEFENLNNLSNGAIKIEAMIETTQSIVGAQGEIVLRSLIEAGNGRVTSAHFGAFDYTASLGIAGVHQHLRHEACNFARQMIQIALAPLGVRLSDSVTTEMPIPVHKGDGLTAQQFQENKRAIHKAWRAHFNNVTHSLINGFYQSWDLHPAQLVARYAAVYSFFLEAQDVQARRLKGFVERATQAITTGNIFDDAASAQGLINFFQRALQCGALTEAEVTTATGLTIEEIQNGSFVEIMQGRL